jgi:putative peptidoglycan lipid II flippase
MSTASAKGDIKDIKDTVVHGVNLAIFAALPAAIGLILFAKPIIQVLFGYGRFDASAVNLTAWALLFYAFGLTSFSMVKIFASCFYSLKDTATPVRIAAIAMIANVGMNLLVVLQPTLKSVLGVGGLALATSISSTLNVILLVVYLRRRIGPIGGQRIWRSSLKFIAATLLMSAAALAIWAITFSWHLIPRVAALVIIAALVYYWAARICKSEEASELLHSLIK